MTIEADGAGQAVGTVIFRGSFRRPRPRTEAAPDGAAAQRPANVAAMLAFAHHVQRLIDKGRIADYADAARRLGWTRARVSQVMDLLLLAPDIQEKVLFEGVGSRITERSLRAVARSEAWAAQLKAFTACLRAD